MTTRRPSTSWCNARVEGATPLFDQLNFPSSPNSSSFSSEGDSEKLDVSVRQQTRSETSKTEVAVHETPSLERKPVHENAAQPSRAEFPSEDVVDIHEQKESRRVPRLSVLLNSSTASRTADTLPSRTVENGAKAQTIPAEETIAYMSSGLQGFLFSQSPEKLQEYLTQILTCPRDYGIYVSNKLKPGYDKAKGVMCYRKDVEYEEIRQIHGTPGGVGVYLCQDKKSGERFVLKRIARRFDHRLTGLEFLTQHNQPFLPEIYGVYKEKDEISIFQEYVEGGTLLKCQWDICQIRQFAETLLVAFRYLHSHDLVHGDVKLMNVMVKNLKDPKSIIIIDFESAKHPQYDLRTGGYTLLYLPPWYERILGLSKYDPILKTADLWAIGCILVHFVMQLGRQAVDDHSKRAGVWGKDMESILQQCRTCSVNGEAGKSYCDDCRKKFKQFLAEEKSHRILVRHLHQEIVVNGDEARWALDRVKELLFYLMDTTSVDSMSVDEALKIIKAPPDQT